MRGFLRKKLAGLCGCSSGNAALIVALGMPMLIGGAGIGVDMAQWYMWKRELQFAVDQAAVAGAWARADNATKDTYKARATQEFNANVSVIDDFAVLDQDDIDLADYNGGVENSVVVEATASKVLPFSSFLTDEGVTIMASARAVIEGGQVFTACMLALDPEADSAFILGGSVDGDASCGFGAISNSDTAMVKNGQSKAKAGWLVSNGGIDAGFGDNGKINAYTDGLTDPFEELSPPESPADQDYFCPPVSNGTTVTTADVTSHTQYTFVYKLGKSLKKAAVVSYADAKSHYPQAKTSYSDDDGPANKTVENGATEGLHEGEAFTTDDDVASVGTDQTLWEIRTTKTDVTYDNVVVTTTGASDGIARPQPGTYPGGITIGCETQFAPGVYIVQGDLNFGSNLKVTGSDVMFVLEDVGGIHINDTSNVNLSGITAATLESVYGMSGDSATALAGMLIYDPESTDQIKFNGGADIKLNGIMYTPQRNVWFNGNSDVSGTCLMIAAGTIHFTGSNTLKSFCVPAGVAGMQLGGQELRVRLVT